MRRILAILVLAGFLAYTGIYIFVYLFRAFRLPEPSSDNIVYVWHGDPMIRAVLVSVLFAIGLVLVLFVLFTNGTGQGEGTVKLRPDVWTWLSERASATSETPDVLAERAVAAYRASLEEGRPIEAHRGP